MAAAGTSTYAGAAAGRAQPSPAVPPSTLPSPKTASPTISPPRQTAPSAESGSTPLPQLLLLLPTQPTRSLAHRRRPYSPAVYPRHRSRRTPRSTFLWSLVKNAHGACTQCTPGVKYPQNTPRSHFLLHALIFPCSLFRRRSARRSGAPSISTIRQPPPPVAVPHDTLTRQKKDTESTARRYTAIVDKKSVRAKGLKLSASRQGVMHGVCTLSVAQFSVAARPSPWPLPSTEQRARLLDIATPALVRAARLACAHALLAARRLAARSALGALSRFGPCGRVHKSYPPGTFLSFSNSNTPSRSRLYYRVALIFRALHTI